MSLSIDPREEFITTADLSLEDQRIYVKAHLLFFVDYLRSG